ncbi:hypothetical protein GV829_04645 [Sphingomonas lacunae]|uniref:Phage protein n=1 Tax=Sphingomonas lacunae TaxID=2698828 RepID=A0A6M4ARY5_9SPHN|nr:hypothetical protein [Sphingomonas lacunae]QJQ31824.1 hypothetical protein GV829_04645 [Sphingomonas lacunae]
MSGTNVIQASFNGGALSRRLQSRVDTQIYGTAVAELTNMIPTVEGPLIKRPGTRWRAEAPASASWLSPFVFNATQAYVLVWSDQLVHFMTNDAVLLDESDNPVEVEVPYSEIEATQVSQIQSNDVLRLAHENHPPAKLIRTGAATFTYAPLALKVEPFATPNSNEAVFVYADDVTGTVTLNAIGGDVWQAGHVGAQFRIEAEDFSDIEAWQPGIDGITIGTLRRSEGKVYRAETSGRTGNEQPLHTRGAEWDGSSGTDINSKGPYGVRWAYVHDRFGIVRITGFTSATEVTAEVVRRIPSSVTTTGSYRWSHGWMSDAAGWPHLVTIYRGRLCLFKANEFAGSVLGDYEDFSEYNEDAERSEDMGFRRLIDAPDRPLWCQVDGDALLIGTSRGEFSITPQNTSEIFSGGNMQIKPNSWHGSEAADTVQTATETIFIQRGGHKIRAARYAIEQDRRTARNLLLYARQMGRPKLTQLAYQAETEELLWALRSDGTVAVHSYNPDQDVKGWAMGLSIEGAAVRSICVIPSTDGSRDDLWLLVDRGGTISVEQLAEWWDEDAGLTPADSYHLDSGVSHVGAPVSSIGGLLHLAGETVAILADGAIQPPQVVANDGTVTISPAASKVHVGKLYTARMTTLSPDVPMRDGTSQGRRRRLNRLIARLIDSFRVFGGDKGGKLDELTDRPNSALMGSGPGLFSGTVTRSVGGGWNSDGQATLESRTPFPWILSAIIARIELGDQ